MSQILRCGWGGDDIRRKVRRLPDIPSHIYSSTLDGLIGDPRCVRRRTAIRLKNGRGGPRADPFDGFTHSHSMVAGGLLVISYTTRFTESFMEFVMRVDILSRTSRGIFAYVAVIPSMEATARMAMVLP